MSVWGRLTGAASSIGGPIGALLNKLGHFALDHGPGHDKQVVFTVGVIALGAKMAKADGIVTRDEIEAFKEVFKVPAGEEQNVGRLFNLAKQDVAGYESYARQLDRLFHDDRALLSDVMDGLFHIAMADGHLHPNEDKFLRSVAAEFGFTDQEYLGIKGRHFRCDMYDPYNILNASPKDSDADLKMIYHKLVAENHPDKLIARGVPPEFIDTATKKLAAINAAYEEIRASRRSVEYS
jgi:DnaJ like chaperone protein